MLSQTDIQGLRDAGMPDDEILNALQSDDSGVNDDIKGLKAHGLPATEILNNLDKLHSKKTGFGDALQYGSAKALEGVGRTLQSFETTKDWGDRALQAGQSIDNEQDYSPAGSQVQLTSPSTWGNIPRAVVEAAPGAAASIAGGVAGAAAGGAVGSAVPIVGTAAGAFMGGLAGAGLGGVPSYMGDRLQNRLQNNGQPNTPLSDASTLDKLIAGGTAFGEGALNHVGVGGALGGTVKGAGLPALAQLPYQIGKAGVVGGGASAAGDALTQTGDTIGTAKGLTIDPNEVGSAAITGYGAGALGHTAKGLVQDVPQSIRFAGVAKLPDAARDVANIIQGSGEDLTNSKGAYKALQVATDSIKDEASDNVKTLKANNAVDPDAATLIDATLTKLDKGDALSSGEMDAVSKTLQAVPAADDVLNSIQRYQVLNTIKGKGRVDDASKTVTGGFNAGLLGDLTNPIGAIARKSPMAALGIGAAGGVPLGEAALHAVQHGGIEALSGVAGLAPVVGAMIAAKLGLRGIDAATGFNAPVDQFASRFAQPGPNQILVSAAKAAQARQALQNGAQPSIGAPQPNGAQLAQAAQARAQALAAMHGQGQAQAAPAAPTAAPAQAPAFNPSPQLGTTTPTARFGQLGSLGDDRGPVAKLSAPQPEAAATAAPDVSPLDSSLMRATRRGAVQLPDPDHAALFDLGERVADGHLNQLDLVEAKRLLARFKGYVDDSDSPLVNTRHVGEMARDYYRDVFDNSRRGAAPDMLASDEARVAWLKRGMPALDAKASNPTAQASLTPSSVEPSIIASAKTKQSLNGSKPNGSANGSQANGFAQSNGTAPPSGRTYNYHGIEFPIPNEVKYLPGYLKSLRRNQDMINDVLSKDVFGDKGSVEEQTHNAIERHRVDLKTARNQDDARGVVNRIVKQSHADDRAQLKKAFDEDFFKIWSKKSAGPK
jgi:hypothetical protein